MSNITLQPSATWLEKLFHTFDTAFDLLVRAVRDLRAAKPRDLDQEIHAARVRRQVAHGCSGQALM